MASTNIRLDVLSIGKAAGELQLPVSQIHRLVFELGIQPAARINGIDHFDTADVERLAAHVRRMSQQPSPMQSRGGIH